ncbi:MAG TPA: PIN domain-containing protein [Egibacteraceae bacterium]|nr:PIN domain-containing protein [Egibacteraceae bacterium]
MIHLDTHVLVWLAGQEHERIPASARRRLERDDIGISPMAQLELAFLFESGKISRTAAHVLAALTPALQVSISSAPFAAVVGRALELTWTRDPFDRLITAQALADGAALLTADATIRAHCPSAVWDGDEPATGS